MEKIQETAFKILYYRTTLIIGPIAAVVYIFAADVYEYNHMTKSIGSGADPNSTIDDERVWKTVQDRVGNLFSYLVLVKKRTKIKLTKNK